MFEAAETALPPNFSYKPEDVIWLHCKNYSFESQKNAATSETFLITAMLSLY